MNYGTSNMQAMRDSYTPAATIGGSIGQGLAQTATRQPEVVAEMDELARAVDVLESAAATLIVRMQPVLSQCGANMASDAKTSAPEPVLCGVAGTIRNKRRQVDQVRAQLERAISELEI